MSLIGSCRRGNFEEAIQLQDSEDIKYQLYWALISCCQNGYLEMVKWLCSLGALSSDNSMSSVEKEADINFKLDWTFKNCCRGGDLETAKWLYRLSSNIQAHNNPFMQSYLHEQFEVAELLLGLDPTIISKHIKSIRSVDFDKLGISAQSAILFEHIKNNTEFPEIDEIEDSVLRSLEHYHMIDHLTKLSVQFPYINFEVDNGNITEFNINRVQIKSARNSFS